MCVDHPIILAMEMAVYCSLAANMMAYMWLKKVYLIKKTKSCAGLDYKSKRKKKGRQKIVRVDN